MVVHHDLREVGTGVVHRRLRFGRTDDHEALELAHGCVSCTLREDVLPLLVGLARKPGITQIVLHLDPVLEPEQVCWALLHVLVDPPRVPQIDAPAGARRRFADGTGHRRRRRRPAWRRHGARRRHLVRRRGLRR